MLVQHTLNREANSAALLRCSCTSSTSRRYF